MTPEKSRRLEDAFNALHQRVIVLVEAQEREELFADYCDEFTRDVVEEAWERMLGAVYAIRWERKSTRRRG